MTEVGVVRAFFQIVVDGHGCSYNESLALADVNHVGDRIELVLAGVPERSVPLGRM